MSHFAILSLSQVRNLYLTWLRKYRIISVTRAQGGLRIFVYGGVRIEGKIQTPKHGFPKNFAPKLYWDLAYLLPKNMGKNCVLVINLMLRDYF